MKIIVFSRENESHFHTTKVFALSLVLKVRVLKLGNERRTHYWSTSTIFLEMRKYL